MNSLEFRPLVLGSSHPHERGFVLCLDTEPDPKTNGRRYKSQFRRSLISDPGRTGQKVNGAWKGGCYDFFTKCKMPHGVAILGVSTIAVLTNLHVIELYVHRLCLLSLLFWVQFSG